MYLVGVNLSSLSLYHKDRLLSNSENRYNIPMKNSKSSMCGGGTEIEAHWDS